MTNLARLFSETLVDEWVRAGLRLAFVAPGSRSTPLALALAGRPELHCEVVLDERSAAFMALGSGLATGRPAVVLTTSGTAVTHLHAAVVEAHLAEVPLLVCSADRPPELYDVGAAQTIDQRRLFGDAVRAYLDLGPPDPANRAAWRSLASRAIEATRGVPAGPVQLNLSFREPLVGEAGPLPPGRSDGRPWHRRVVAGADLPTDVAEELAGDWRRRRGVLVAGAGLDDPAAVRALAARLGWPVLADPRSGARTAEDTVVAHADAVLRVADWAAASRPEVVVQLGALHASKVLAGWVAAVTAVDAAPDAAPDSVDDAVRATGAIGAPSSERPAELVVVNRAGSWWDPDRRAGLVVAADPGRFCAAVLRALDGGDGARSGDAGRSEWGRRWRQADDAAATAIEACLVSSSDPVPTEPAVARAAFAAAIDDGAGALVVSSSMPVRDLEWYAPRSAPDRPVPRVLANRGANGIDGVMATAVGAAVALAPAPVWVLIGDLAFLHDANTLLDLRLRPVRLRLVVVDNGGGGIFSFLPQATAVDPDRFEQLFGTRQHVDVADVLRVHGIEVVEVDTAAGLGPALAGLAGADVAAAAVVVRTADRSANVAVHAGLHAAVAEALHRLDGPAVAGATGAARPVR
jgi:2-succinyl-5-enolpyruvyl-6-hydroxy-3-cyclohexene-1-carboxylate synthase